MGYNTAGIGAPGRVKTYAYKLLSVGLDGGRWVELPSKSNIARFASETVVQRLYSPNVIHRLPEEDDWVMIEWLGSQDVGTEVFKVTSPTAAANRCFSSRRAMADTSTTTTETCASGPM